MIPKREGETGKEEEVWLSCYMSLLFSVVSFCRGVNLICGCLGSPTLYSLLLWVLNIPPGDDCREEEYGAVGTFKEKLGGEHAPHEQVLA